MAAKTLGDYYGPSIASHAAASLDWLRARVGSPVLNEFVPIGGNGYGWDGIRIIRGASKACNRAEVVTPFEGNWVLVINGRSYVYAATAAAAADTIAAGLGALAMAGEPTYREIEVSVAGAIINCVALAPGAFGNDYTLEIYPPAAGGVAGTPDTFFTAGAEETGLLQCQFSPPGYPAPDFTAYPQTARESIDVEGQQVKLFEGGIYPGKSATTGTAYGLSAAANYIVRVYTLTDALYQQGADIVVPAGTAGTYFWGPVQAAGPVIIAKLFKDGVEVCNSNQGVGPKLTNCVAKTWIVTDIPYLQEQNLPVVVAESRRAVVGGLTVFGYGSEVPMVTVLDTQPTPNKTIYTTRAPHPAFGGLPRSSALPTIDPYYRDVEEVLTAGGPVMQNRCWIYDAAMCLFAYTAGGYFSEAIGIVDSLNKLVDLRVYMPMTAYEDAEDGLTSRWSVVAGSATIENWYDPDRGPTGTRAIKFTTGATTQVNYTPNWNKAGEKMIEFWLHSGTFQDFGVRFQITSSAGTTGITFTGSGTVPSKVGTEIQYPIGVLNAWRILTFNLDTILKQFNAADSLTEITRVEVRLYAAGSISLDNVTSGDLQPDGSLSFSYDIYFGHVDYPYIRCGALAWVALAYEYLREKAPWASASIDPYLARMLNFLVSMINNTADLKQDLVGLGYGRYANPGYGFVVGKISSSSTEHNLDAYFALRKGGRILNNSTYSNAAESIRAAMLNSLWIAPTDTTPGHFASGTDGVTLDTGESVDSMGTWTAMMMHDIGDLFRETECLKFVKQKFHVTGKTIALVPAYDTTSAAAIPAGDSQWVTPASMNGIVNRGFVEIGGDANKEGCQVWAVEATRFLVNTLRAHNDTPVPIHTETRMNLAYQQATPMEGYKPYNEGNPGAPDGVWSEGTWGAIAAFLRAMENTQITSAISGLDAHVQAVVAGQKTLRSTTPDDGALLTITQAHRSLPYEFMVSKGIAQTAWFVMEAVAPHVLLSDGGHPHQQSYSHFPVGRGYSRAAEVQTIVDANAHAYFGDAFAGEKKFGE